MLELKKKKQYNFKTLDEWILVVLEGGGAIGSTGTFPGGPLYKPG